MKKLNRLSAFPVLFVTALLMTFGVGRFAIAKDGTTVEVDVLAPSV
ncbi:MAG TPA: hypothetical protein VMW72_16460 [Sedimentisphaerales bacterium]|nr:hypothetical protein [Sedimentisphaerales bacterium]